LFLLIINLTFLLFLEQRTKELSYAVRLCHLNTTNADGTRASSFGFELNKNSEYEYPIITHVESKSPGERSGLQVDDIVLKVNKRKTKGANIDKVRKLIDKAKNNGRIEVLVIDKEAFHYCLKTNRKFKEPYIKVKHIFPRSRSSVTYQSVPLMAARASMTSQVSFD
jgi:C-terminal processing protease CtpA/Prc